MKRIFHFIACSNNTLLMDECRRYIDRLFVPEGWRIEVTVITDAKSMCEGYNRAAVMHPGDPPRTEDVPVRIWLHQDVYLINRFFLHNLLMILQSHPDIGLIGMAGTPQMHPSGVWWNGEGVGCLYTVTDDPLTEEEYTSAPALTEVASVDGFCMVTRADIPWREDLFDGFDFYDVSLSYEIRRAGLRVVVPDMRHPWCVHDDGRVLSLYHYNHYRKIFLEAYGQEL